MAGNNENNKGRNEYKEKKNKWWMWSIVAVVILVILLMIFGSTSGVVEDPDTPTTGDPAPMNNVEDEGN